MARGPFEPFPSVLKGTWRSILESFLDSHARRVGGRFDELMGWKIGEEGVRPRWSTRQIGLQAKVAVVAVLLASLLPRLAQAAFSPSTDSSQEMAQGSTLASAYLLTRDGASYRATPEGGGTPYVGTLKQVMESAARDLNAAGGGTMTFASGMFDFGSDKFIGTNLRNIAFQGQGIDVTVLQNVSNSRPTPSRSTCTIRIGSRFGT